MPTLSPREALERLIEGNHRFRDRVSTHSYAIEAIDSQLLAGQNPIATVFGCADSRVPLEVIFDQGFGDLFVIRNAGHIVGESVLGSMEFAILQLGCPLIVVTGHSQCGAVRAAVKAVIGGEYPAGHIRSIVTAIEPVVRQADSTDIDAVERAHVTDTLHTIYKSSSIIADAVRSGDVWLVAAKYRLATQEILLLNVLDAEAASILV